jgi:hypothetical protein
MANANQIPSRFYGLAREVLERQDHVPLSPAAVSGDGRVELCAAACLAYVGLRDLISTEAANAFAIEIARTRSFRRVEDAFDALGWPRSACTEALKLNDGAPEGCRKFVVSTEFQIRVLNAETKTGWARCSRGDEDKPPTHRAETGGRGQGVPGTAWPQRVEQWSSSK